MNMQVGPLHAAVPLEGTDTVTGLLELERRAMRMQTQMAASTAAQCRDNIVLHFACRERLWGPTLLGFNI